MLGFAPVVDLGEADFQTELTANPERAWRTFIDRYSPTLLALIERAGVEDRDEAMDIYVLTCHRLSANHCAALRRWDATRGPLASWLAVVVRRAAGDWIRSRAGRRRLFGAVKRLAAFQRQVFELYYWRGLMPTTIAQQLTADLGREVHLGEVFEALAATDAVLSERHRSDLLSLAARARPVPLDLDADAYDRPAEAPDPESALHVERLSGRLRDALASLPPEDAAIVSLRYIEGLSVREIQRLLRLDALTEDRVRAIAARLRAALT